MKIKTVYLITKYFDESLEFYRRVLETCETLVMPWGRGEDKLAFFDLENFKFMLSYEEAYQSSQPQKMWIELQHDDPESLLPKLKSRGIEVAEELEQTPGGSLAFAVTDPDGNVVRIGTPWQVPTSVPTL
jgi:uncharacterized glyoxalase superfamily protein PhnB